MSTNPQTTQLVNEAALPFVGGAARATQADLNSRFNTELNQPLRLAAGATPDSKLYFTASEVEGANGSGKTIPPIDDRLVTSVAGTVDFQTLVTPITGITLTRNGQVYAHPTASVGQFIRLAFVRKSDGSYDCNASAAAASVGALTDAGALFSALDGLPVGFVDLQCTNATGLWKTAGSATSVIENKVGSTYTIHIFGAGGGSGGSGDRTGKISALTSTVATLKGGYIGLDDGRVLSSGSGTTAATAAQDVAATMATVLTASGLSFTANRLYALVIDLTTLGAAIQLDNLRTVYTWTQTNMRLIVSSTPSAIDPRRYVLLDEIYVPTGAVDWSTGSAIVKPQRIHDTVAAYFPYIQRYSGQITSAVLSTTLTHGLDAEPQMVSVYYYDGTSKNGVSLSNALINKTATQLMINTAELTFGSGQYVEVQALYVPTVPNIAGPTTQYTSPWYTSTATTTQAHGRPDKFSIRGVSVIEWDVTNDKLRMLESTDLVKNWDATNLYYDWTGLSPSATMQYMVVAGLHPVPYSVPNGNFDSITDRSGAGAPNFPNGATGISTGINTSPIVKTLTKQLVGSVGSAGQIAMGHQFSAKSYRPGLFTAAYWRLNALTDGSGGGRALTNTGAVVLNGGTDILGATGAARLTGSSSVFLSSTDAIFDQGTTNNWAVLAWVSLDNWNATQVIFALGNGSTSIPMWGVQVVAGNGIRISPTASANSAYYAGVNSFAAGSYHAIGLRYVAADATLYLTVDGVAVTSMKATDAGLAAVGVNRKFTISGFAQAGSVVSTPMTGYASDAIFINDTTNVFTDADWRKLHATRYDHATGVAVGNQRWVGNFYGAYATEQDNITGWIVDKYDTNSLFLDFSGLAATDQVELFMENKASSPTTVGSVVPYDVIHTVNPTFPIAHGQTGVPEIIAEGELTSGEWEPITLTGQVTVDSTNLRSGSSLAAFFTAGYLRVRLVARSVGPVQTGVPLATTGLDGMVASRAKGRQNFGGVKGFNDGAYSVGAIRAQEGAGTSTLTAEDNRHQVFSLTAARTCVLPSTSVLAGEEWRIENQSATFGLTIQSSALATIATCVAAAPVRLRALQDAPTTAAHWMIVSGASPRAPTQTIYASSSGTYTVPAGVQWLRVRMVGGGGGGSGSGTGTAAGINGSNGGDTTFGSSLLTAAKGLGGQWNSAGVAGGSATVNLPAVGIGITGGTGQPGAIVGSAAGSNSPAGAIGASSAFGGAGNGGASGGAGAAAATNSGSGGGGGGGGATGTQLAGNGGSAAAFIDAVISSPSATYSYAVGGGGSGGNAGTSGFAGGAGGSGIIVIEEHY